MHSYRPLMGKEEGSTTRYVKTSHEQDSLNDSTRICMRSVRLTALRKHGMLLELHDEPQNKYSILISTSPDPRHPFLWPSPRRVLSLFLTRYIHTRARAHIPLGRVMAVAVEILYILKQR
jgi:hypothetical protein